LDAEHAVDLDAAEVGGLLRGDEVPSGAEVAERSSTHHHTTDDAPQFLGGQPSPAPGFPPAAGEGQASRPRAMDAALTSLFGVF